MASNRRPRGVAHRHHTSTLLNDGRVFGSKVQGWLFRRAIHLPGATASGVIGYSSDSSGDRGGVSESASTGGGLITLMLTVGAPNTLTIFPASLGGGAMMGAAVALLCGGVRMAR